MRKEENEEGWREEEGQSYSQTKEQHAMHPNN